MSGYLHRLVHTVLHPRETVHPRTRPLFAAYRSEPDSATEFFEQAETAAAAPARSEPFAAGELAETVRYPRFPLLPTTANEPPRIWEPVQRADVSPAADNEAQHEDLEHTVEVRQQIVAAQAQRAESYLPLIQPQRSEANSSTAEIAPFSTKASRLREADEGRPTSAEREPDEIQIHIGRIEVTAVQPPAPRAPKSPDKNISLDAYLERRNGRAR